MWIWWTWYVTFWLCRQSMRRLSGIYIFRCHIQSHCMAFHLLQSTLRICIYVFENEYMCSREWEREREREREKQRQIFLSLNLSSYLFMMLRRMNSLELVISWNWISLRLIWFEEFTLFTVKDCEGRRHTGNSSNCHKTAAQAITQTRDKILSNCLLRDRLCLFYQYNYQKQTQIRS